MTKVISNYINLLTHTIDGMSSITDHNRIHKIIEKLLIDFTGSDFASLLIFDQSKLLLHGGSDNHTIKISMVHPNGLLGKCFLTKESAVFNYAISEKNYIPEIDNPNNDKFRSLLLIPILEDDNLIGIIRTSKTIYNDKKYTKHDLDLLNSISPFLINTIHILTSSQSLEPLLDIDDSEVTKDLKEIEEEISIESESEDESELDSTALFFSNAIHDIRTPANTLYGFLELIEDQIEDKRIKGFIENAKESAESINTLIDSILDHVKSKNQTEKSKSVTVNTVKFFAQDSNTFTANMFHKEIKYIIHIHPLVPKSIRLDTAKLKRVIINLIGNAYKFTPKGKQINFNVKFDHQTKKLKISIKDTGIGIADHRQKEIFEAFKQAECYTADQYGGTGLGLAICSKYINDLGGTLKLKSTVDKGSKFYFSIPVEIIDATPSYERFFNLNKKITILTDNLKNIDALNIYKYLVELGMPSKKITISQTLDNNTTHLFCFQHKFSSELLHFTKQRQIKLVVVEEKLFSLNKDPHFAQLNIISKNTYYGDIVHSSIFSGNKIKVLIADDNKINIMLLKAILETEYCDITTSLNGKETLETLMYACCEQEPFDIAFLDRNMPDISGSEVLKHFRAFEQELKTKPLFGVSITGDPDMSVEEKKLYDLFVNKPFKKQDVIEAINLVTTPNS